jgi:drug/metabolite transporter (DMT)-like permease
LRPRDIAELIVLAALWGGSFLVMRSAAPDFGAVGLAGVRVAGAALFLVPLLAARGLLPEMLRHWRAIAAVGILNSALPFLCFSYAALSITAGLSAIFNSATPLFAALIAWAWLADRMTPARVLGLAIGFAGVVWIAWDKAGFKAGGSTLAVVACLGATLSYGIAPNLAKRHLAGVTPLAVAAGSQLAAAVALALPAVWFWPAAAPSAHAWLAAAALAFFCTGLAYILYFRLIANAGPANAVSVTFLVPIFAVAWGGLFLGETLSWPLVAGCAVVFAGTALATGLVRLPGRPRPARTA